MTPILFINGCPRPHSRTRELAGAVLEKLGGPVTEVRLFEDGPGPLNWETLQQRDALLAAQDFSHPMFRWAKDFAQAETIVVAAPYWDLMFPAAVRSYFEAVTVSGLTFVYGENGIPRGLCRAKRLIYVTTAGGPIHGNFGYDYICALARGFYGIEDTRCISAEMLDVWGENPDAILKDAKASIAL